MKKINIAKLFYSNKFVMFFSIIVSIIAWCGASSYLYSTDRNKERKSISEIPIEIVLTSSAKNSGYQGFFENTQKDLKAIVQIEGNFVNKVTKNDLRVVAKKDGRGDISFPGVYRFELNAQNIGDKKYEIISLSPQYIELMVDRNLEKAFDIQDNITRTVSPELHNGKTEFSPSEVKVYGPESEVNKIDRVSVQEDISGVLNDSYSFDAKLVLYDKQGNVFKRKFSSISNETANTVVLVYNKKTFPAVLEFKKTSNIMDYIKSLISYSPEKFEISGPKELLNSINEIKSETINFSKLGIEKNSLDLELQLNTSCFILNETKKITVKLNSSGLDKKKISIKEFEKINLPNNKELSAKVTYINIEVIGPRDTIQNLNENSILSKIDFSGKDKSGRIVLPVSFEVKEDNCWVFGEYTVTYEIK
ncbi:MAG: hypothetical protein LBF33_03850 [Oscillospiraceae bacterium]|jgi:YbbR domain-containing protein|nr:hypothetical protein [Oscillospiraceae bacterium]